MLRDKQTETATVRYDLSPAAVESELRDKLIEMGWTPPGEKPEPLAFPDLPAGIVKHQELGELYDRLQVQQYAMRYAMLHANPQSLPAALAAEYTRGRADGWEAAKAQPLQEGMVLVSKDRNYDVRVESIIAFNQCAGDLDDKLEAAHLAMISEFERGAMP